MPNEHILLVEDEGALRSVLTRALVREGFRVTPAASGEEAVDLLRQQLPDLVVTDLRLPGLDGLDVVREVKAREGRAGRTIPVLVVTAVQEVGTAVAAMREGAFHYLVKGASTVEEVRLQVARALEHRRLESENLRLKGELRERFDLHGMVGRSPRMQAVRDLVERVSRTRINCLITGESGTGKEVVARAVHAASDRSGGPFVAVNCGAIPESLFEAELFGHRKGAFTGADRERKGAFQAADGGTLFLDEIGEMPLSAQVKLLRVIQERKVTPLGSNDEIKVDVRLLAATNRDLAVEVREGRFREDLYYRLNVVQIDMPPLRERRDDVPELVRTFVERFNEDFGKRIEGLTPDTERLLAAYPFPGNVRELQNLVERAVALEEGPRITPASLPPRVREGHVLVEEVEEVETTDETLVPGFDLDAQLARLERGYLVRALRLTGGNRTHAARALGITFRSMRHRLKKFGMDDGDLPDDEPSGVRPRPPLPRA